MPDNDDDSHQDGINRDDLQQLFSAIRNCSDLVEGAEARMLDVMIDDDCRRRDEHKAVLEVITELHREVAGLRNQIEDGGGQQGAQNEEWVPSGEVDFLEEPIMVRRRK
jgi:hypothetical protein